MAAVPDNLNLGKWDSTAALFATIVQNGIFVDLAATTKLVIAAGATAESVRKWMQPLLTGSGSGTSINTAGTAFSNALRNVASVGNYIGAMVAVVAFGISVW